MKFELRILGSLEGARDGRPVNLGPRRQRAVLARLIVERGRPVSIDRLIEDVWGGRPPEGALRTLRSYLSRLRAALGAEVIVTRAPGYALAAADVVVDSDRFELLAGEGRALLRRHNARAAAERLGEALALWRGRVLEDLPPEPFVLAEAARLEELRFGALEDRIEADLELGRHAQLCAELELLVTDEPLRERLWAHLMTALYRAGRQADALEAYQRARRVLDEQLGLAPGEELRRLEGEILRHELAPPRPDPLHNLPAPVTAFVGRRREVAEILACMGTHRLVTLTGAGGSGKTRVAIEAAARALTRFPDGAWLVDLTQLTEPTALPEAAVATLGIEDRSGRPAAEILGEHLRRVHLLLVLDNCEHVSGGAAALAERLVQACPHLHVLATSREPLAVAGELVYEIPPLASPPADAEFDPVAYDAVQLFLDRARADVPPQALGLVATICRELDGLPLAIEIAAAQTRLLSLEEIAERLADRFRLLTYWSRTATSRHQTLRASLDWSYGLLRPEEATLLRRLAVFAGGFDLPAIEAIADDFENVLPSFRRLVDASLVVREESAGGSRFRLLETIRRYALDRAAAEGDVESSARRHARHFAALADAARAAFESDAEPVVYAQMDADQGNIRAALEWAHRAGDHQLLVRLALGMGDYWRLRAPEEGTVWLRRAVEACRDDVAARADLLFLLGHLQLWRYDLTDARANLAEAVELTRRTGSGALLSRRLHALAFLHRFRGEFDTAQELLAEALELARADADRLSVSHHLGHLGDFAMMARRFDESQRLFDEAWAVLQPAPPPALEVPYWDSTARLALARGDIREGAQRAERGARIARELGDQVHVGLCLVSLAYAARRCERTEEAASLLLEALELAERLNDAAGIADALDELAGLLVSEGDPEAAAVAFAAAATCRHGIELTARGFTGNIWIEADVELARSLLGEAPWERASARGRAMSLAEAVTFARAACRTRARIPAVPV